jgi:hypothetical protein
MSQRIITPSQRRRQYIPGYIVTLAWVLPTLALAAATGYFTARKYVAPKLMPASVVRRNDERPTRVLSPQEASLAGKEQPSPVWTEGVRKSDIPKVTTPDDDPPRTRRTRTTRTKPGAAATTPTTRTAPVDAPPENSGPPPVDTPVDDGAGDGATP